MTGVDYARGTPLASACAPTSKASDETPHIALAI